MCGLIEHIEREIRAREAERAEHHHHLGDRPHWMALHTLRGFPCRIRGWRPNTLGKRRS